MGPPEAPRVQAVIPATHPLHLRWAVLFALILAETVWLTYRFSVPALDSTPGWLARLTGSTAELLRICIGAGATLVIVAAPSLSTVLARLRNQPPYRWWGWAALHGLVFFVFVQLTAPVFGDVPDGARLTTTWLVGWGAAGCATLAFWLLAVAPSSVWLGLAREQKVNLALSAVGGIVAWLGGLLAQKFWQPLAEATLRLTHRLLTLIYPQAIHDVQRGLVGTPAFLVEIAPECSGYEGIALATVFVSIYLWIFRKELAFPRALLLFPVGIVAIWIANVLRVTALIVVGTSLSPEIAVSGFHSQAGWISFTLIALGLIAIAHRFLLSALATTQPAASATGLPLATPLLAPLLTLMATSMVGAALSAGFDALYPLGVITTSAVLWYFREHYRALLGLWTWQSVAIGVAVFLIWMTLEPASRSDASELTAGLAQWPTWLAVVWIAFRVVGSVVIVPIAEELAFRSYLIRKFVSRDFEHVASGHFTWFSFLASSLLFGLLHGRLLAGVLAGAAFALALYQRGRVGDAIIAHMTSNALIAVAVLAAGRWGLWE